MREIKFRGKSKESGEWVYGDIRVICADNGEITINYPHKHSTSGLHMTMSVPVDPDTVGQYSGQRDKNKVEIYEGDIVRSTMREYHVIFEQSAFMLKSGGRRLPFPLDNGSYYCIVGNIYDTPELRQKC